MPARTRTKRRSTLPPLKLSTLLPCRYNIRPDEANTVTCPSCETWQRIMGDQGKTRMIRDHYSTDLSGAELGAGQRDTRCPSARRIVEIDVRVATWAQQVEEGSTEVAARRPTKVLRKVKTPLVPALHQLVPAAPTADSAHAAYAGHRRRCAACTDPKRRCTDGLRLGAAYLKLVRQEEQDRTERAVADRVRAEREQRDEERIQADEEFRRRQVLWAERYPAAENVDMVRRSTPLALHADSRRRLYGPDLQIEERDTREASRALAETRTEAAIRQASPLRSRAA